MSDANVLDAVSQRRPTTALFSLFPPLKQDEGPRKLANELLHLGAMNITLKTKIRCNGKEYSSVDELPPEIRALYERAIAGGGKFAMSHNITPRLVINGQEISSTADMSVAEKKLYDDAMQLIRDNAGAHVTTTAAPADPLLPGTTAPRQNEATTTNPKPVAVDSGWLTKRQVQLILLVAAVVLGLALIIGARH